MLPTQRQGRQRELGQLSLFSLSRPLSVHTPPTGGTPPKLLQQEEKKEIEKKGEERRENTRCPDRESEPAEH